MPKNEIDSDEVDASEDNSKVDASEDKGASDNADDSSKSQDDKDDAEKKAEEKPEKKIDLEEETYKVRYANSTKELQAIKKDPVKLREFLGLDPDASLDEHFGVKAEQKSSENDDEDSKEDEEKEEKEDQDEENESEEDTLAYGKMGIKKEEQAAIDFVWDAFAEKHPDIDKSPKVREAIQKNFFRFLTDDAGNRRKLKNALEDTYRFISMDKEVEKAKTQARNEGIIKATANKEGAIQSSSSKQTKTEDKSGLSDSQKAMAKKLGVSEADYLKNIQTDDED